MRSSLFILAPPKAIVMIGDESCYKIRVPLAAKQSLRDIKVTVTLISGGSTVNASWTVNTFKCASSIIEGDHSEEEKALVRDMLSYAVAAYAYFNNTEDSDKIAAINALLGEDYDSVNAPDMTKDSKMPAKDRGFKDVTLNLGDTPSYRFYLQDGFGADDFRFTSGGAVLETETDSDANGDYIEVIMHAYRMCDDVSYTVTIDGVKYTESYTKGGGK